MAIGKVLQFRRGKHVVKPRHFIIEVNGVDSREKAEKLVGKEVTWKSPAGKVLVGRVSGAHGNKGAIRAIFEIGLPGQAITTKVDIK